MICGTSEGTGLLDDIQVRYPSPAKHTALCVGLSTIKMNSSYFKSAFPTLQAKHYGTESKVFHGISNITTVKRCRKH